MENKETVKAAENKEAGKENAEAPKKKKTIIFVSNPQNSRVPGQPSGRNNQGQGNRGGMNGEPEKQPECPLRTAGTGPSH